MMHLRPFILIFFILLTTNHCLLADGLEQYLDLEIGETYTIQNNYYDRGKGSFTRDESYNLLRVTPSLSWVPQPGLHLYGSVDFLWQSPVYEDDEALEANLTAAYLDLSGPSARLTVGGIPMQFGRGLIMADETLAAIVEFTFDKSYLEVQAARIQDSSPMASIGVGYRPSRFEYVQLFGVWFSDRDDIIADAPLFLGKDRSSSAELYWLGASAELFVGPALFSMVGAYQTGRFTVDVTYESIFPPFQEYTYSIERDVSAYFFDLALEANVAQWGSVGAFCYVASGDEELGQDDFGAYTTIGAYNPRLAIFFDPNFIDSDNSEQFTFGGVTRNGVVAPGVTLTVQPVETITLEASAAMLYAHEASANGDQRYGYEIDGSVTLKVMKKHEIFLQAARFEHGNFFESRLGSGESFDPAFQFLIGGRLVF
ncbi:MAG: hypothetical protein PVG41_12985 [Desulfobacteraceae bacterium]